MTSDYYTKLSITLETSEGARLDGPGPLSITLTSEMSDCNVHAWFQVFQRVLALAGFSERNVMSGGCQLAFNEMRSVDAMRDVAKQYDLRLLEDLNNPATDGSATSTDA